MAINKVVNGRFCLKPYNTDPIDPAAGLFLTQLGRDSLGMEYIWPDMMLDRFNAIIKQTLTS